jgi:hypothetical protein
MMCSLVAAVVAALALACGGQSPSHRDPTFANAYPDQPSTDANSVPLIQPAQTEKIVASIDIGGCPATQPDENAPPSSRGRFGSDLLWTILPPRGIVVIGPGWPGEIGPDGSLSVKWGWWESKRLPYGITVEGRSLDGTPGSTSIQMSAGITGSEATNFWASSLTFPAPGCWEITARAGEASLTFVTFVVRAH